MESSSIVRGLNRSHQWRPRARLIPEFRLGSLSFSIRDKGVKFQRITQGQRSEDEASPLSRRENVFQLIVAVSQRRLWRLCAAGLWRTRSFSQVNPRGRREWWERASVAASSAKNDQLDCGQVVPRCDRFRPGGRSSLQKLRLGPQASRERLCCRQRRNSLRGGCSLRTCSVSG